MVKISYKKILTLLMTVFVLAFVPAIVPSAAVKPGFVNSVKATNVKGTQATLTWSRAKNAFGYHIYKVDPDTGDRGKKPVKTTSALSCTVEIVPGKLCSFQVFAYRKNGNKVVENIEGSPLVDVKSAILRKQGPWNGYSLLLWDKVKKANGYILYRYDEKKDKYVEVKTFKKASTTSYKAVVPAGKTYKFMLRSFQNKNGKKVLSEDSNVVSVLGRKIESVHPRRCLGTLKSNLKITVKDKNGKKVTVRLKKGTQVITSTTGARMANITLLDGGKKYTIKNSNIKYSGLYLAPSYDYYTKEQAEAFVNGQRYSSKTGYLIWISQYTASVHIFKGYTGHWKRQRVAQCVIGSLGKGLTKVGEYELLRYEGGWVYFYWNESKNWGQAFHGLIDKNSWGSYSAGCVRLGSSTINYVRSLPLGTKVIGF